MKLLGIFIFLTVLSVYAVNVSCSSECNDDDTIKVKYVLWIGDDVHKTYHIPIRVPRGSKMYDVMLKAAEKNTDYDFDATYYNTLGYFITKIGDNEQVPADNKYWLFFITDSPPKKNDPPGQAELSPLGVSSLEVLDDHYYLFWLRTADFPL